MGAACGFGSTYTALILSAHCPFTFTPTLHSGGTGCRTAPPTSSPRTPSASLRDPPTRPIKRAYAAPRRAWPTQQRRHAIQIKHHTHTHKHRGQFYVQKRTTIKDYCPGFFEVVAGGVVQVLKRQ